jgi:hypothetical protein
MIPGYRGLAGGRRGEVARGAGNAGHSGAVVMDGYNCVAALREPAKSEEAATCEHRYHVCADR